MTDNPADRRPHPGKLGRGLAALLGDNAIYLPKPDNAPPAAGSPPPW